MISSYSRDKTKDDNFMYIPNDFRITTLLFMYIQIIGWKKTLDSDFELTNQYLIKVPKVFSQRVR